MVLGDTVNTASRLQSIAAPGTVLVDDVTRRASEAAIAYEDAGQHQVKGREQPVHAWTALRVVAGAGGARRSAGLEAPFVGRERELAHVIESFEASAERAARLVTVVGEAGSGKSRLLWEFFKYMDGVERGRPLAPGSMPLLRRRGGLLGAGRDGARPRGDRARRRLRRLRARSSTTRWDCTWPTSASASWSSRGWRTCWARAANRARPRRPVQRLAAVLRADVRGSPGGARVRGPPVGRLRIAGVHRLPARVVRRPAAVRARARPAGAARLQAQVGARGDLARAAAGRGDAANCSRDSCPDFPRSWPPRCGRAPRGCRCTRSRPCGCCSIAVF